MDYTFLLGSIENILGKSYKRARENHAFNCPFCNHHKPKLEINFRTNEKGQNPWECWVCETKGRTIRSLLYQLKIPREQAKEVLRYVPKSSDVEYREIAAIQLPKEFKLLHTASSTSIIANKIKRYLYERGFSDNDFIKYNVGYCTAGEYGGRIIIPSYSESNILNYFIARTHEGSYHKYRNPEVSKDIIFFENFINWNQPVILCEGVFDAIAIKRNAIPILGKTLSNTLIKKIISSTNKDIYIALDTDARNKALGISEHLLSLGKRVFLVELTDKDPSDMGFEQFTKLVQTAKELDLSTLMMHKLEL
jgi:DNA primase|tara:strand:- start:1037 stop:1960 length:924 start_codon:yes stop_codon:yes gene_type:complete